MTARDSQPDRPDHRPIDEAQLLDWIDGHLSPSEQSRLERASGRAGLSDRIAQMQSHKRILESLPDVEAPADLMDRVLATLERDQLVGGMPAQIEDMVIGRRSRSRWPGFAIAAGVMLLVGGASYIGLVASRPAAAPVPGPVAKAETRSMPINASALRSPGEGEQIADARRQPDESQPNLALSKTPAPALEAAAAPASEAAPALLAQAAPPPQPEDVPLDRAAELAGEGRLAIRVVASDTRALSNLEQTGRTNSKWRLRKDVPASVAAAVLPTGPRADVAPSAPASAPAMASADFRRQAAAAVLAPHLGLRPGIDLLPPNPADPMSRVRGTYLVELPAEVTSLQSLKKLFADRLRASVVFEELPPALAVTPPATPDTMLWWAMGPDHWSPRASVPLVVETR